MPVPTIVTINHGHENEPVNKLIGLRVTDPGIIGDTIVALGGDADRVEDWTVYTDYPQNEPPYEEEPTDPRVVLRLANVHKRMVTSVGGEINARDTDGSYSADYVRAYTHVVGASVIRDLAYVVALEQGDHPSRVARIAAVAAPIATGAFLFASLRGGTDMSPLTAAIPSSVVTLGMGAFTGDAVSTRHYAEKRVDRAHWENPYLLQDLGESILPIFKKPQE